MIKLILALVAILGLAVPNAAVCASCQYAEFPPEPPAGGAVLWSSSSDPTVPNTLVLGLGEQSDVTHCPAPIQTPWVILVAPGGALVFHGHDTEMGTTSLVSPWGAVNVPTPGEPYWNGSPVFFTQTLSVSLYASVSSLTPPTLKVTLWPAGLAAA